MFKAHIKSERGRPGLPSPRSTYVLSPPGYSLSLPCTSPKQFFFFGNASALFQGGMKVGFGKFFCLSQKPPHFPPRTITHEEQERRSYPYGASNPPYPQQSQQHPAIFKWIKNSKKKLFKIVSIKPPKSLPSFILSSKAYLQLHHLS